MWVWVCILVEVDATVGELAERSLLLDLGRLDGVLEGESGQRYVRGRVWGEADEGHGSQEIRTYSSAMIAMIDGRSSFEICRKTKGYRRSWMFLQFFDVGLVGILRMGSGCLVISVGGLAGRANALEAPIDCLDGIAPRGTN